MLRPQLKVPCEALKDKEAGLPLDDLALSELERYFEEVPRPTKRLIDSPLELVEKICVARRLTGTVVIDAGTTVAALVVVDGVALGAAAIHEGHVLKGPEALSVASKLRSAIVIEEAT